ncbi:MAG: HAD family hydrolase [Polyangiaceae bacterium]
MSETHRAWLVDLDGTLYRARPVKLRMALALAVGGWGVVGVLRKFRHVHEELRDHLDHDVESPFLEQVQRTASALSRDAADVERIVRDWMVLRPLPHLARNRNQALLDEISNFRAKGGKTACVSDYPAREKLEALGAVALFDVIVASGEISGPPRLKPHPAGYLRAAKELGVDPSACLVIGDRDDADGEAARRANMSYRKVRA